MLWAQDQAAGWSEAGAGRTANSAVLMGHSRGGAATALTTASFQTLQQAILGMDSWQLCGAVGIAPRYAPGNLNDVTNTDVTIDADEAVPYLLLQGALDPDTIGQSMAAFDRIVPEDALVVGDDATYGAFDRNHIWTYGVWHHSHGGVPIPGSGIETNARDRAHATTPHYIERFLTWQLFSDPAARQQLMIPMDPAATTSSFHAAAQPASLWSGIEPQYDDLQRPLVYASYVQAHVDGSDPNGPRRFVVDTLARGSTQSACGTSDPSFLGPSTLGLDVEVGDGMNASQVCQGPASALVSGSFDPIDPLGSPYGGDHRSEAISIQWGDDGVTALPGGSITWSVEDDGVSVADLSGYSHLALRIANLAQRAGDTPGTCAATQADAFDLVVELLGVDPEGNPVEHALGGGTNVEQHLAYVVEPSGVDACVHNQYMHTFRIPLRDFCDQGNLSLAMLTGIRVTFPDDTEALHHAFVDSIEFTGDPLDPPATLCGQETGTWTCAATGVLTAVETSCSREPTPTCPSAAVVQTLVPLPTVPDGLGGQIPGWIVSTPPGWIADVHSPTSSELDDVTELCQAACKLEWSDNPHVSATCSSFGAFATPSLRATTIPVAEQRIPDSQAQGAGLFTGQSLACELEDDCCLAFDEDVCAGKPRRTTAAAEPLARGEEFIADLGGSRTSLEIITPGGSDVLDMTGRAGYSLCAAGSGVTCPFYVGSLSLASTAPITVTDTCPDSSSFSATIDDLLLEILQPAFGIANASSNARALPTGALYLEAKMHVEGLPYTIRATNQEPVNLTASSAGAFAANLDIEFDVPCGSGRLDVTARFDIDTDVVLEYPPAITIGVPSTVTCPSTVQLASSATDADGDLASVRWRVDGVLVAPTTTSIKFTQGHTLEAIARDARGATKTATKTVSCQ